MGMRELELEENVKHCEQGSWSRVTSAIVSDRYSAGSIAVELALALFRKGGVELVERLHKELEYAEECS